MSEPRFHPGDHVLHRGNECPGVVVRPEVIDATLRDGTVIYWVDWYGLPGARWVLPEELVPDPDDVPL
jgi:hypothetical protein